MEILKHYDAEIDFVVPSCLTNATFEVFIGDTKIGTTGNAVVSGGIAKVNVPYAAVNEEGIIRVLLSFTHQSIRYDRTKEVAVVKPYLELHEIAKILDDEDATQEDYIRIEAATRHIINAHTGQDFGFEKERAYLVRGNGGTALTMPKKLNRVISVAGNSSSQYLSSTGGWTLHRVPWGVPPIKADNRGFHMHQNGVIHNPNAIKLGRFVDGYEYEVVGDWGWAEVPDAVSEAARLLVNDYSCADSAYRDRYLVSMTAADWRIQFNSGAYRETGNVRADQLLSDYTVYQGWGVV